MIQVGAENQAQGLLNTQVSETLSRLFKKSEASTGLQSPVAFVGYTTWRREENGDANLFDEQVLVIRNGQVRFLKPGYEIENFSPNGLSWGYHGSATGQLAIAMLMEVLQDENRVRRLWPRFHDLFVKRIPDDANWTADGADILRIALAIENHHA